jgi:hypothetical protein
MFVVMGEEGLLIDTVKVRVVGVTVHAGSMGLGGG